MCSKPVAVLFCTEPRTCNSLQKHQRAQNTEKKQLPARIALPTYLHLTCPSAPGQRLHETPPFDREQRAGVQWHVATYRWINAAGVWDTALLSLQMCDRVPCQPMASKKYLLSCADSTIYRNNMTYRGCGWCDYVFLSWLCYIELYYVTLLNKKGFWELKCCSGQKCPLQTHVLEAPCSASLCFSSCQRPIAPPNLPNFISAGYWLKFCEESEALGIRLRLVLLNVRGKSSDGCLIVAAFSE